MRITSSSPNAPTGAQLRILIVDTDAFFRRGVREILNESDGIQVIGEAGDGDVALRLARDLAPRGLDLVLLDNDLPDGAALTITNQLTQEHAGLHVVTLADSLPDVDVIAVVRAGAAGVLSKHLPPTQLVQTLLAFQRGESLAMSREVGLQILDYVRHGDVRETSEAGPRLTSREREILLLVSSGARDRDIAERLVISESTVKKHVQNILRKFQARNRAEAVARWRSHSSA